MFFIMKVAFFCSISMHHHMDDVPNVPNPKLLIADLQHELMTL